MIRRVGRGYCPLCKTARGTNVQYCKRQGQERGGKIYLQAVIINQHHAASSTFLDKSTFSIRNFGRLLDPGRREEVCTRLKYCICLLYIIRVVKRADFNEMF